MSPFIGSAGDPAVIGKIAYYGVMVWLAVGCAARLAPKIKRLKRKIEGLRPETKAAPGDSTETITAPSLDLAKCVDCTHIRETHKTAQWGVYHLWGCEFYEEPPVEIPECLLFVGGGRGHTLRERTRWARILLGDEYGGGADA